VLLGPLRPTLTHSLPHRKGYEATRRALAATAVAIAPSIAVVVWLAVPDSGTPDAVLSDERGGG
jgi:hypothetical protein